MGFDQISDSLKSTDNRVKAINDAFLSLPNLPYLDKYFQKYSKAFFLAPREAPSKGLSSQEKDIDKDKDTEKEDSVSDASPVLVSEYNSFEIESVITIEIPLQNGKNFPISSAMIIKWQEKWSNIDVIKVLQNIREWNLNNPQKRKNTFTILKHINYWMENSASNKTAHNTEARNLFNKNQAIGEQWLFDS